MKFNRINRGLFFIVSVMLVSGNLHSVQEEQLNNTKESQNEEHEYSFYTEINNDNITENLGANNFDDNPTLNTSVHSHQQQPQQAFVVGFPIPMVMPVVPVPMVMQVVPVPMVMQVVPAPVNILLDELQNIKGELREIKDKVQNVENTCNEYREDQKIILDNQNLILNGLSDLKYESHNTKRKIHNIYSQVNKDNYNSIPRRIQRFRKETHERFNDIKQYLQNNISNKAD